MSDLFVLKEQLQKLYTKNSKIIDKTIQFFLALSTFWIINSKVGFMKPLAQPIATIGLTIICTFLPLILTVVVASIVILLHMYAVSMGIMAVVGAIFLLMYIFFLRLTPKQSLMILLTPLAFGLKMPYIIPIAYGLVGTPVYIVPIICGSIIYYMLEYIKISAPTITAAGAGGMVGQMTTFIQQIFQNKEMWVAVVAFTICILVVYTFRKQSMDHAWEIAIVVGAVSNIVILVAGDIALNIHTPYISLVIGTIASVLIAFVLEFFVFTVDYSRTERLQFEDDEYYYYVKAVPKLSIAAPEKTVKRINERQDIKPMTREEIEKKIPAKKPSVQSTSNRAPQVRREQRKKPQEISGRRPERKADIMGQTEELLLAKSLRDELNIQGIVEKELGQ
ncbi:MAG: hypothetical protein RSA90_05220 [Lachnospiraceae bacterium]